MFNLTVSICMLTLYQCIYMLIVKNFTISKTANFACLASSILIQICWTSLCSYQLSQTFFLLSFMIMLDLSFTDIKYLEISGKSYLFVSFPIVLYLLTGPSIWYEGLISSIIVSVLLVITDKIASIESIGGADIKLLVITSALFSYKYILFYLLLVFIFDALLYIIIYVKNKLKKRKDKIAVPMIVAITLSLFVLNILNSF